ncbi:uncharacterized protein [Arachis hypogaea]|uniref:uncharacterized protein isoform X2 n=1 Tax=Arachis hypogaea TaxID=3818 RepID=UPI0034E78C18|nr:putative TrmH family tRNA/rRNA methyltransferase [Arachis hypogaea]
MAREKKEVLPAPPFIPVISRAHRRCVFKEKVSLEELPSAISSLTHLTDMANLFSLQVWAGFGERSRDGNKFVVAKRLVKQVRRNFCTETEDDIVEEQIRFSIKLCWGRERRSKGSCPLFGVFTQCL